MIFWIVGTASGVVLLVIVAIITAVVLRNRSAVLVPANAAAAYSSESNGEKGYHIATKSTEKMAGSDLLLSPGDVTLGRKLAQGAGGQIFKGRFIDQDVALKESYDMLMNDFNNELVCEAKP